MDIFMGNVIQLDNINPKSISDKMLAEIEKYMSECFHEEIDRKGEATPIFEAKKHSIKKVAKKYNLSIEKTNEIVSEIKLRNLDKDLGLK